MRGKPKIRSQVCRDCHQRHSSIVKHQTLSSLTLLTVKSWQQYKLRLSKFSDDRITKCQCLWKNMYHPGVLEEASTKVTMEISKLCQCS